MSVLERFLGRQDDRGDGPKGLSFAPLRKRDLRNGVMEIEAQAYPKGWSNSVFASEIEQAKNGQRHYIVARRDGVIVGYAGLWFAVDEAHVTNIAVDPAVRRQGIARQLLLRLAEVAVERGCVAWTLEVRASSRGAQDLYRKFGFAPAGIRQRYYDNVEDAIVMWCHEIQADDYRDRLNTIREQTS